MEHYIEFDKLTNIAKITEALKDLVRTALQEGYSKKSYTINAHIKYLKSIQSARNPDAYIWSIARKTFPDDLAYNAKLAKVQKIYKGKEVLISKYETLYELYHSLPKGGNSPWNKLSAEKAENALDELLSEA